MRTWRDSERVAVVAFRIIWLEKLDSGRNDRNTIVRSVKRIEVFCGFFQGAIRLGEVSLQLVDGQVRSRSG